VLNPDRNGVFVSKKLYENVGFARIVTGARAIARCRSRLLTIAS